MKKLLVLVVSGLFLASNAQAEKLTLLLDWFVNPDHGPLYVAEELGYFEEVGLQITMIEPTDPSQPPLLVAAGQADLAVSYQPQLHLLVEQGIPISRVGTLVATPLNSLVVLENGPIKSIADLNGATIGYSVGGFETAVLSAMLEQAELTIDDVSLVNVNFALSPSLYSGRVDAVIGAFRNFELNQMDIEGKPGRAFYPEENGVPPYDELILVAQKDNLNDSRFPLFLDAIERATQYIINHPEEAWSLFIKGREGALENELNRRAWVDTLPRFAMRPASMDFGRYARFSVFLKEQGLLQGEIQDPDDLGVDLGR